MMLAVQILSFVLLVYLSFHIINISAFPPLLGASSANSARCLGKKLLYGHEKITKLALLKIVQRWFLSHLNVYSDDEEVLSNIDIGYNQTDRALSGLIWHYQHAVNTPLKVSIERAFEEIVNANSEMDSERALYQSLNASFHFDGEEFYSSNTEIANRLESAIDLVSRANYSTARMLIGEALNTLQDFYSHSNWVELHSTR